MIKVLLATVLVIFWASFSYGQNEIQNKKAYKFAEFGTIENTDLAAKLDAFREELRKDKSSQGYIIIYGSSKAIRARRNQILHVGWSCRDCGEERLTFVDGPTERKIRTVIWIVPEGAEKPKT